MLLFGLGMGALLAVVGLLTALFAPIVGPNPIFGFRIGYAYASRDAWDRTNRFGGILFALVGVVTILLTLGLLPFNLTAGAGVGIIGGGMGLALLVATAVAFAYARNVAQGVRPPRELVPVAFNWTYLAPVLLTFAVIAGIAAYANTVLPETHVASHFNLYDQPDGYTTRGNFLLTYLGICLVLVLLNWLIVIGATREPMIAISSWGSGWRLTPEKGLILVGVACGLANLILAAVLLNVVAFNARGTFLFPFSTLLWMVVPLVLIIIALFFLLARREPAAAH